MTGHYRLDVEPATLRGTARALDELASHIRTKATTVSQTPGEVGTKWQGAAAESVKENMTALGQQMDRYDEKFAEASAALGTLAGHYEHALEVTIPSLNKRWNDAQAVFDDALAQAGRERDDARADHAGKMNRTLSEEISAIHSTAVDNAAAARRTAEGGLDEEFEALKRDLRTKTTTCADALSTAVIAPVTDAQVEEFRRRSTEAGAPSPMSIGALDLFDDDLFTLAGDARYAAEGEVAAKDLAALWDGGSPTQDEVDAYLARVDQTNPAFRRAFVENLDSQMLLRLQSAAHYSPGEHGDRLAGVISSVAEALAEGSDPELQGLYPVSRSVYDRLIETYERYGQVEGEGLMLLAEIVHAGQQGKKTWESGVLTAIGEKVLAFERAQVEKRGSWTWSQINPGFRPLTDLAKQEYPSGIAFDPLAMIADSMHHDPAAAQDLLVKDSSVDSAELEYLYGRTAGANDEAFGSSLGGLLDSATQFVGGGGPGSRDYVSAQIVNSMVEWYAEHQDRWRATMDQDVIDIMARFMPAVNHPGQTMAPVREGDPEGQYSWQRLTMPNLDPDKLGLLMEKAFGADYNTDDDSRPRYAQFAAVQAAALQVDFLEYAAAHGLDGGQLEELARQQGELKQRTINWFRESLVKQGVSEDEANKESREAADTMASFLTEAIPLDRLGSVGGEIAGSAIDGIKEAALNAWFPETELGKDMEKVGLEEEIKNRAHGPDVYLNWLDQAGLLSGTASVEGYVAQHPDASSFTVLGEDGQHHLKDIRALRAEAQAAAKERDFDNPAIAAWEDFMDYYTNEGAPFLSDNDINTNFQLGSLVQAAR